MPERQSPELFLLRDELRAEALRMGFSRAGFTTAEPLSELHQRRWWRWLAEGKAGVMGYLTRETPRRTHPRDLLPEAQTALVVMAGYYQGDHGSPPDIARGLALPVPVRPVDEPEPECVGQSSSSAPFAPETGPAQGDAPRPDDACHGDRQSQSPSPSPKVARYAWGKDYHLVLRERLTALGEFAVRRAGELGLATDAATVAFRPCVDSAPLDERSLAVRAGLGFIGKNTLLLDPQNGSWGLIGVLLLALPLPQDEPLPPSPAASCGSCRRCLEACPTGALTGPYQMDPRRCLSYLTIEQRDEIPAELAEKMNGWGFGCDICQEVCPYNAHPLVRLMEEFRPEAGIGPYLTEDKLGLRLAEGEEGAPLSGKAFLRRWGHTPLARPGLKGLLRNLRALRQGTRQA